MLRFRHNLPIRYIRSGNTCRTARYTAISKRSEFLFSVSNIKVNNSAAALRDAMPPFFRLSVPLRARGTVRYASCQFGEAIFFHSIKCAAALRDATLPCFRQFVPTRECGTIRYGLINSAAALRDATPPLFRQSVPLRKHGTSRYVSALKSRNDFFIVLSLGITAALRDATPPHFSSSNTHLFDTAYCNAAAFSVGSFKVSSLPARRTWPPGYPFFGGGGLDCPRLGTDRFSPARPCLFLHFGFRSGINRLWPVGAKTGYFTSASRPAARRTPERAGFDSMISASFPFFTNPQPSFSFGLYNFGEPVDGGCLIALFPIPAFRPGRVFWGRVAVNSGRGNALCFVERRRPRFSFTPFRQ